MIQFDVNRRRVSVTEADGDMPLLWFLRESLGLTGTKYGCGIGLCGACTVHIDGRAVRACQRPVGTLAGASITTIEGLAGGAGALHPLQRAWMEVDVPQCGYCQSGQIMAAAALLKSVPQPGDGDIDTHMTNLCRCGSYSRIRRAIHRAAGQLQSEGEPS